MPNPRVSDIVAAVHAAPAALGATRLVLVDGPAGAGKTTLANRIAVALGGAPSAGAGTFDPGRPLADDAPVQILHGDDMYEGWDGLPALDRVLVDQVLVPLAADRAGAFRMWDWSAGRRTHLIEVPSRPFLVVEGVGVASRAARAFASCNLYVDAPWELRLARGIARDGEAMRAEWERWHPGEDAHLAAEGARDAAHAVLDGAAPVPD
ncbi:uridine kinase family protein [Demequina iriomotensis]|uniref:uridine kinase family protein n=1 Tax=Demequina iriomotensis TaxID=1536641 RepID=UPI0007857692|nr:hypothetical protein [Demequina iriomotensis]